MKLANEVKGGGRAQIGWRPTGPVRHDAIFAVPTYRAQKAFLNIIERRGIRKRVYGDRRHVFALLPVAAREKARNLLGLDVRDIG